jgi:hypothetical protein
MDPDAVSPAIGVGHRPAAKCRPPPAQPEPPASRSQRGACRASSKALAKNAAAREQDEVADDYFGAEVDGHLDGGAAVRAACSAEGNGTSEAPKFTFLALKAAMPPSCHGRIPDRDCGVLLVVSGECQVEEWRGER